MISKIGFQVLIEQIDIVSTKNIKNENIICKLKYQGSCFLLNF
jgi:hypothetical protein